MDRRVLSRHDILKRLEETNKLLDSKDIQAVNDFVENLKLHEKESWVVESLISYYISTLSQKAADLIVHSRSEHDKVIFRRLHSTFDDANTKRATLKLLLYIVSKKPSWLYKIVHEPILKDLFSCMRKEVNVPLLLDAVYITTMLLPVVPDGMVKFFDDMFKALLRLIHFIYYNKDGVPDAHLLHLNVGVYSLFARLYGMYPWHYISSLQDVYSGNKIHQDFYKKAVEPMLSTVKLNPGLVTSTRDSELRGDQWRRMETHDIVAECASLSLDVTETTNDYLDQRPVLMLKEFDNTPGKPLHPDNASLTSMEASTDQGLPQELSAPIELGKDSLVATAVNSSTFFSPSDRLGLSTPPPIDPSTPNVASSGQTNFTFTTSARGTPQQNPGQIKTPHNTSDNTPTQYTPKYTPTTPISDMVGGVFSRSRHTSGAKTSVSRISVDDFISPSPLRKEFTSEPPTDIPKIKSVCTDSGTTGATALSVSNLPHLLEKISDTASNTGVESNSNSDDEEVESIITHKADMQTVQSVAEYMRTVNRIRFISMTTSGSGSEKTAPKAGLNRSGSCPTFTEEMLEEPIDSLGQHSIERSASIQTASSNDQLLSEVLPSLAASDEHEVAAPMVNATSTTDATSAQQGMPGLAQAELVGLPPSVYNYPLTSKSADCTYNSPHMVYGAGSILDRHIMLLNEKVRQGSVIQSQLQEKASPSNQHTVNWTHFGGPPPADEVSIVRGQLLLLHTQLLYERQKKDLHSERNRRLLRRIILAEKIKEDNHTLDEQVNRCRDDIFNLQTTIRLQNNEIRKGKDERVRNDAAREQELASLIKENERLRSANEELQREYKTQSEEFVVKSTDLAQSVGRIERLEQDLQIAYTEITKYKRCEDEVSRMKKELLLMGEIQVKYEEKLSALKYDNHINEVSSDQEANYLADIAQLKEVVQKQAELCQLKQSQISAVTIKLRERELAIHEQKKRLEIIQGEHLCKLQAVEDKYTMAQLACQTLEIQIVSLYDQIGRLSTPHDPKIRSNSSTATTPPPT